MNGIIWFGFQVNSFTTVSGSPFHFSKRTRTALALACISAAETVGRLGEADGDLELWKAAEWHPRPRPVSVFLHPVHPFLRSAPRGTTRSRTQRQSSCFDLSASVLSTL